MTTVKENFQALFRRKKHWCSRAEALLKEDSADMYNSSRRPDVWLQGLAYMNLAKARDAIAAIVQHVASELVAGELKTKMTSLTVSMTEQEYQALEDWAEPLRNGAGPFDPGGPTPTECRMLYTAARFLRTESLDFAGGAARHFHKREVDKGNTVGEAAVIVADFMRTQVTLVEWRGSYE